MSTIPVLGRALTRGGAGRGDGSGVVDALPTSRRIPSATLNLIGLALLFTSAGLVLSAAVDWIGGGWETGSLAISAAGTAALGLVLWRGTRVPRSVGPAAAFAAASWTWVVVSIAGAVPFVVSGALPAWDDALFESVSGFTATGSTVLVPIEGNSPGILYWRQVTQWYGGMGMIVLAVAVLPFLGVGGLDLIAAEGPGPSSDRLAPRVSETAKRLWMVYLGMTVLTTAALLLAGMDLYDASAHAMSAVATGGFSPYDTSVAFFDSVAIEQILTVASLAGATSFILIWRAVTGRPGVFLRSPEFRFFILFTAAIVGAVVVLNVADGMAWATALRQSSFNVISQSTTTGFATTDFTQWVPAAQLVILLSMFTGSMSGSTSGAVKLLRIEIVGRLARRELQETRSPRQVIPIRLGREVIAEPVVGRAAAFVLLYVVVTIASTVAVAAFDTDFVTALSSVATAMGGVGPGLGETGPVSNFLVLTRPARLVLIVDMLLGRLEIVPMMLMFAGAARVVRRRRPSFDSDRFRR